MARLSLYPVLPSMLVGMGAALGKRGILCGVCGIAVDIAVLREVAVPEFLLEEDVQSGAPERVQYLLVCDTCAKNKGLLFSVVEGRLRFLSDASD